MNIKKEHRTWLAVAVHKINTSPDANPAEMAEARAAKLAWRRWTDRSAMVHEPDPAVYLRRLQQAGGRFDLFMAQRTLADLHNRVMVKYYDYYVFEESDANEMRITALNGALRFDYWTGQWCWRDGQPASGIRTAPLGRFIGDKMVILKGEQGEPYFAFKALYTLTRYPRAAEAIKAVLDTHGKRLIDSSTGEEAWFIAPQDWMPAIWAPHGVFWRTGDDEAIRARANALSQGMA